MSQLPLRGRRLGDYLQDDCRHAIAHIRRAAGRHVLKFDDLEEEARLHRSQQLLVTLARHYIQHDLGLTGLRHLVRMNGRGFPRYVSSTELNEGNYRSAYPRG